MDEEIPSQSEIFAGLVEQIDKQLSLFEGEVPNNQTSLKKEIKLMKGAVKRIRIILKKRYD